MSSPSTTYSPKSYLRERQQNRYRKTLWKGARLTTCIIGSVCKDGVVLVGDRRIQSEHGYRDDEKKIEQLFGRVVVGASGLSDMIKQFRGEIIFMVEEDQAKGEEKKIKTWRDFQYAVKARVEDLYRIESERYRKLGVHYALKIFLATKTYDKLAELYLIHETGVQSQVTDFYAIGSLSSYYAIPFLKALYNPKMTMKEMETIASSLIVLFEELGIDSDIGGLPQIYEIPHQGEPKDLTEEEIDKIFKKTKPIKQNFEIKLKELLCS